MAARIIERRGAMPVPPAMNSNGAPGDGSGRVKLPTGPSTWMGVPGCRVSTMAPNRLDPSTLTRNSSHPSREVSWGADAMEYGVDSAEPAASVAAWPARYRNGAPSSASLTRRVVCVSGSLNNRRTLSILLRLELQFGRHAANAVNRARDGHRLLRVSVRLDGP